MREEGGYSYLNENIEDKGENEADGRCQCSLGGLYVAYRVSHLVSDKIEAKCCRRCA